MVLSQQQSEESAPLLTVGKAPKSFQGGDRATPTQELMWGCIPEQQCTFSRYGIEYT